MKKFELGQIVTTANVDARMKSDEEFKRFVESSLSRFREGDWGILCEEDKATADNAITNNQMIMGAYSSNNEEIWIITEWNRSVTTILFPYER